MSYEDEEKVLGHSVLRSAELLLTSGHSLKEMQLNEGKHQPQ